MYEFHIKITEKNLFSGKTFAINTSACVDYFYNALCKLKQGTSHFTNFYFIYSAAIKLISTVNEVI